MRKILVGYLNTTNITRICSHLAKSPSNYAKYSLSLCIAKIPPQATSLTIQKLWPKYCHSLPHGTLSAPSKRSTAEKRVYKIQTIEMGGVVPMLSWSQYYFHRSVPISVRSVFQRSRNVGS